TGELDLVLAPALDGPRHRGAQRLESAVGVEQLALPALVEEAGLLMLAVDLDERPDRLGESRGRDRLVVEPRRRPSTRADLAAGDQRLRDAVEERLHARHVGAMADEGRVGPRAEREPQRIDEQALARAGLAGDDVQAGLE